MRWIVIANASGARVLEADAQDRLHPVRTFEHDASRLPTRNLSRDRAGWAERSAHTGGSALLAPTDAHRRERAKFARELAVYLERSARQHRFDHLELFAAPPFLGEMHTALCSVSRRLVDAACPVDLTHVGPAELGARTRHELLQAREPHG